MRTSAVLLISCPDQKGLVATVSDFIFRHGGNILHTDEHTDADSAWFLMRVEFDPVGFDLALGELPPEQREVFVAHEIEGLSFKEIAARTDVGVNTLLSRKRYAVLHLRERLQSIYDDFSET